jgi:hypothetical protein
MPLLFLCLYAEKRRKHFHVFIGKVFGKEYEGGIVEVARRY